MRSSLSSTIVSRVSLVLMLGVIVAGAAVASARQSVVPETSTTLAGCCETGNCSCPAQGACCDLTKFRPEAAAAAQACASCCTPGACCCPGGGLCCAASTTSTCCQSAH